MAAATGSVALHTLKKQGYGSNHGFRSPIGKIFGTWQFFYYKKNSSNDFPGVFLACECIHIVWFTPQRRRPRHKIGETFHRTCQEVKEPWNLHRKASTKLVKIGKIVK